MAFWLAAGDGHAVVDGLLEEVGSMFHESGSESTNTGVPPGMSPGGSGAECE